MDSSRGSREYSGSVRERSPPRRARRSASSSGDERKSRRPRRRSRSRSRHRSKERDRYSRAGDSDARPARPDRRTRSTSKERRFRHTRDGARDDRSRRDSSSRSPPRRKASPPRERNASQEPYRKPRARSRDGRRDRSLDRRDRSRDRRRNVSRDRRRDRSREKDRKKERRRSRSRSPPPYRSSHKRRSRSTDSRALKRRKVSRSPSRSASPPPRSRKPLPSQEVSFRGVDNGDKPPTKYGGAPADREKPNFGTTGLLAKAANRVEGTKISLKYHEPAEARKPPSSAQWRLFVFKGPDMLETIELHTRSCWLLGRANEVCDIVLAHPSSSSQHAVIQFRYIVKTVEDEYGVQQKKGKVKPYVIDLDSSNGTDLNDEELEASRYYELRDKDILKFGGSDREYVIMLPPKEG